MKRWIWNIGWIRRRSFVLGHPSARHAVLRDTTISDIRHEQGRRAGRRAQSDHIAACLLHRDLPRAVPMQPIDHLGRNRRIIVLLFTGSVIWWLVGQLFF